MTRRERHLRILENFGSFADWEIRSLGDRLKGERFRALTDEAVEKLAGDVVRSWRRHQRDAAQNRRLHAAAVAKSEGRTQ